MTMPAVIVIDACDLLRDKIDGRIDFFKGRIRINKWLAVCLRAMSISAGILVTMLLGLKDNSLFGGHGDTLSAIALVMSSVATLAAAMEAFLDPRGIWVRFYLGKSLTQRV
jgi:hypothetical protein